MRSAQSSPLPDFSAQGLNSAWSLRQGGVGLPAEIRNQGCSICGNKQARYLANPGDVFGKRLCSPHRMRQQQKDPTWLAGGDCVRCHRPRGLTLTWFVGRGSASTCCVCTTVVLKRIRDGELAISVEQDAKDHGGCGWCGEPEWGGQSRHYFSDRGENRRCSRCWHHRASYGTERDPSLWDNSPTTQCCNCGRQDCVFEDRWAGRCLPCGRWLRKHGEERPQELEDRRSGAGRNGCKNPACSRTEEEMLGPDGSSTAVGANDQRRCCRCHEHRRRHTTEWPIKPDGTSVFILEDQVRDGCKNLACLLPEAEFPDSGYGYGDERRCTKCYNHRHRHTTEWPMKADGTSVVVVVPVYEGCKNPACGLPEEEIVRGVGSGDQRRCIRCYTHRNLHKGSEWPVRADGKIVKTMPRRAGKKK